MSPERIEERVRHCASRTEIAAQVEEEARRAESHYGPFASTHEGYGVLVEEMKELLDAIHTNDLDSIRGEAIQVSAVAMRIAECCADPSFGKRSGFRA